MLTFRPELFKLPTPAGVVLWESTDTWKSLAALLEASEWFQKSRLWAARERDAFSIIMFPS